MQLTGKAEVRIRHLLLPEYTPEDLFKQMKAGVQASSGWGSDDCAFENGFLDVVGFYVGGVFRDCSRKLLAPFFRGSRASMARSIAWAKSQVAAQGRRPPISEWEKFVKRAGLSAYIDERLFAAKAINVELRQEWLAEAGQSE